MTYVNGKLTSSKVAKRVVTEEAGGRGRRGRPGAESRRRRWPSRPGARISRPPAGSTGAGWRSASRGNPNAYNPAGPYYGLYQFDVQTWQANGGTGTPSGKSIAEQTRVAYNLYQPEAGTLAGLRQEPLTGIAAPPGRYPSPRERDGLLGPAEVRALAAGLGVTADQAARAELPARPEHGPAHRARRGVGPADVVVEVGPGSAR